MIDVHKVREGEQINVFAVATINWLCFGCYVSNEKIESLAS